MNSYSQRVQEQIEQFREVKSVDELPDIFHYWSNKYLLPLLQNILEVSSYSDFFVKNLHVTLAAASGTVNLLSIGCGDCTNEIGIANELRKQGVNNFLFECIDLSPVLINKANTSVAEHNLDAHFHIHSEDLNSWTPHKTYCGIMACQSLHHILELEKLFQAIFRCLHPKGLFIVNDTIGRNGHMRWPESLEIINKIWPLLPDRLKINRKVLDTDGSYRFEESYQNHDCSAEGFEGIRAQDILPLLIQHFHFDQFLAFGNLPDIFTDRCFGHNYDPKNQHDIALIDFLEYMNELLIELGHIKPTMMFAVMSKVKKQPTFHKNRTPDFCVRHPDKKNKGAPPTEKGLLAFLTRQFTRQ